MCIKWWYKLNGKIYKWKYIANKEIYEAIKDSITCPICQCLMTDIMECMKCQNVCCKKCLDDWKKKGGDCPNRCKSEFRKVIQNKNLIYKLKFRCINGSKGEINYEDLKKHYENCKPSQKKESTKKSGMKLLSPDEMYKYKKRKKIFQRKIYLNNY